MPERTSLRSKSQRDFVSKPRVATKELPWVKRRGDFNAKGVAPGVSFASMPQSLSVVYIHLVFSTKERRPFLRDSKLRQRLLAYLGSISKRLDCAPIVVGGVEDHVHLLARFGRTITQADWVKELKRVSNNWIQQEGIADFQWQAGYADFSVSQSNLERVQAYIMRQEEHHKNVSFQDELRALLRKHRMEWDERYLWD
jgi:putative transposase